MIRKICILLVFFSLILVPFTSAAEYHDIVAGLTDSQEVSLKGTILSYDAATDADKVIYRVEFRVPVGSSTEFTIYRGTGEIHGTIHTAVTTYPWRIMNITLNGESDSEESFALVNTEQSFNIIPCYVGEDTEDTGLLFARWTYGSYKAGSQSIPAIFVTLTDIQSNPITEVSVTSSEEITMIVGITPYDTYLTGDQYVPNLFGLSDLWDIATGTLDVAFSLMSYSWVAVEVALWGFGFLIEYGPIIVGYEVLFSLAYSAYQAQRYSPQVAFYKFVKNFVDMQVRLVEIFIGFIKWIIEMIAAIVSAIGSLIPFT